MREQLIERTRAQITAGTYETAGKLDLAIDRFLERELPEQHHIDPAGMAPPAEMDPERWDGLA